MKVNCFRNKDKVETTGKNMTASNWNLMQLTAQWPLEVKEKPTKAILYVQNSSVNIFFSTFADL